MQLTDEQFIEILNTITTQTGGTINGTINEKHKQIVEKVLQEKYQSTQLSQILDMPERSLKRYLAMLTQNGCIAYEGAKKTGGYVPTPEFLNVLKQYRDDK
jgi:predicted HTH transcriptional regulator